MHEAAGGGEDAFEHDRERPTTVGEVIIVDHLRSVEMRPAQSVIYDREIELRELYQDPLTGAEHYLIRYPAGLKARSHRHTAAHTIVVLEGTLQVNDQMVGAPAYCHFPRGEAMFHAPAGGQACLFVIIFDAPLDVEALADEAASRPVR